MSKGVLYIGSQTKYFKEATKSAQSLLENTDTNVAIVTTKQIASENNTNIFNDVITLSDPKGDMRDKVYNFDQTPYDKTIYLDADTTVIDDISPLFELLDRSDLAASISTRKNRVNIDGIPDAFPELNNAVVAYNSSNEVMDFLKLWEELYSKQVQSGRPDTDFFPMKRGKKMEEISHHGQLQSQIPFREALFKSNISYSVIPNEYNFGRWGKSYAEFNVKIIHGSEFRRKFLSNRINNKRGKRIFLKQNGSWKIIYKNGGNERVLPLHTHIAEILVNRMPIRQITNSLGVQRPLDKLFKKIFH